MAFGILFLACLFPSVSSLLLSPVGRAPCRCAAWLHGELACRAASRPFPLCRAAASLPGKGWSTGGTLAVWGVEEGEKPGCCFSSRSACGGTSRLLPPPSGPVFLYDLSSEGGQPLPGLRHLLGASTSGSGKTTFSFCPSSHSGVAAACPCLLLGGFTNSCWLLSPSTIWVVSSPD